MTKTQILRKLRHTTREWDKLRQPNESWTITPTDADPIVIALPLGAAVELEEAGMAIQATRPASPSDWEV